MMQFSFIAMVIGRSKIQTGDASGLQEPISPDIFMYLELKLFTII